MEGPTLSQAPPDNSQDDDPPKVELPEQLQKIVPATDFPNTLTRWNTNEEIAAILIAFDRHKDWLLLEPRIRPPSGSLLMYNRKKVMFRRDGYCWKKRRDGKTNREDHMKLKVKGVECIYGSYVHSAILPTFHRRCYWLLQNPHVVIVHYLNVPNHPNSPKPSLMPFLSGDMRKKEWTKEELVDQLRPMLASGRQGELHPDQDHKVEETLEAIFQLLVSAQDDGTSKSLPIKTQHQSQAHQSHCSPTPVGGSSTVVSNHDTPSLGSVHSQMHLDKAQHEMGLVCLQQQGSQNMQGCISSMAHLQVAANSLSHQQQSAVGIMATSTTAVTVPHHQNNLQLSTVSSDPQHLINSSLSKSPLSLATFSHVHMTSLSPSIQSSPSAEGSLHAAITHSLHRSSSQQLVHETVTSLASPDQSGEVIPVPVNSISLSSITQPLSQCLFSSEFNSSNSSLFKSGEHQFSKIIASGQQQFVSTSANMNEVDINISHDQGQNHSNSSIFRLCPNGLIIKGGSLGSVTNEVAISSHLSIPHHTHQTIPSQLSSNPGHSKDIPLLAANSLTHGGNSSSCDNVCVGSDDGGSGVVVDMGLADSGDNCDTLDGSFSSLPSTDLNLDLFLDLQDLDDCSPADLAAATSLPLSPVHHVTSSSPTTSLSSSTHLTLATSASFHGIGSNVGGGIAVSSHLENNHGAVSNSSGSFVHASTSLNAQSLQPQSQTDHNKILPPSLWNVLRTISDGGTSQSNSHYVCVQHHVAMSEEMHIGCDSKVELDEGSMSNTNQQSDVRMKDTCQQDSTVSNIINNNMLEQSSTICDFSPEWGYTEGNTKILIAGPWCNPSATYTCIFNSKHVPASLVQPGVLRCFTPAHKAGSVKLQIACNGIVISNSEVFEFRASNHHPKSLPLHAEWFDMSNQQLKQLLLERLKELERRFISGEKTSFSSMHNALCETQESSLLTHVETLTKQQWSNDYMYPKAGHGGLTLLHLAAGLGFAKLISTLIRWRNSNPSPALEYEVDAHSVDNHACTPLMWACSKGQIDAALTLYHWNVSSLRVCNKDGHLPLAVARKRGHYNLATQVEQLEQAHFKTPAPAPAKIRCQNKDITSTDSHSSYQPMSPDTIKVEQPEEDNNNCNKDRAHPMQMLDGMCVSQPLSLTMAPHGKLVRRFSEQVLSPSNSLAQQHLSKRYSVDLLTSELDSKVMAPSMSAADACHMRDSVSEPRLPLKPDIDSEGPSHTTQRAPSLNFVLEADSILEVSQRAEEQSRLFLSPSNRVQLPMDTDDSSIRSDSPFIDVERVSSDDEQEKQDDSKHQMVTLANQIIAAMPERIKLSPSKGDDEDEGNSSIRTRSESHSSSAPSQGSPRPSSSSFGDDSGISTPMTDSLAFDEYRYTDFGTPASSLSPDSTCLPSPYSPYTFALDSPPPTTAEFTEYFNAPATYMEKDFSQLTLSDQEQRKLYEAAKVIQNAYRHYRDKQQQQQHQKEIEAAVLIQSYYRRYKQYAYYKKMTQAAVLIQNQFRSYSAQKHKKNPGASIQGVRRESERLKKGRNQSVIIQQRFRSHYQRKSLDGKEGATPMGVGNGDAPDSSPPPEEKQPSREVSPPADVEPSTGSGSIEENNGTIT